MWGEPDEYELYRKLGVDKIAWVFPGYGTEKYDPNVSQGIDPWGVPTVNVQSGLATYQEYGTPPLGEMASPDEIDEHLLWPDPERFNYAAAKATAERARAFGFATIGPWISHFEIYCHMRGMENVLMDTIAGPSLMENENSCVVSPVRSPGLRATLQAARSESWRSAEHRISANA
jgi:uroporphyrinogen decarboxylase